MSEDEQLPTDSLERADDLQAYRYLLEVSDEARQLSTRCWSRTASSALKGASEATRLLASAIYRDSLDRLARRRPGSAPIDVSE